jgi:IPT/TIG domain-containing protein
MNLRIADHRYLVVGLCTALFAQLIPIRVEAKSSSNTSQITVNVGKPTIWSLAQAHYLLANMRQANQTLQVPLNQTALDPNAANGARMDILRTFLGAEAQYSGVAGLQNRAAVQKYNDENARRQTVQARLDLVTQQYLDAVRERSDLVRKLSKVQATDPNAEQRRKDLQAAIDQKEEQDALNAEMTALNGQLTQAPSLGNLNSTAPFGATTFTPKEGDLDKIITAIVEKTSPRLSASASLDNYIQMQYEVIAKQLTLLRDEVGPGERLIFLELPSDVYSVPKRDDDYVVQVEWKVKRYFGRRPGLEEREDASGSSKQSDPITLERIKRYVSVGRSLTEENLKRQHPGMSGMDWIEPAAPEQSDFRVVDVIPRQSALNVNDVQAQTRGFALAAKFLTVFGLGGQVSYERQRTIYGQFMQQDVYASGYGKGSDRFGWTFGPTPGTRRLAPGVRTTYAIMTIPEAALAIELEPIARIYRRDASPQDAATRVETRPAPYQVLIPNEHTEGFWIDSIAYTPVRKGGRITAVLGGRYFSPLTGVLVDGAPLKRAVSIAKNESNTTNLTAAVDAFGEYEYLNPGQIILSFKMPDQDYVGTPLITLVTPERTSVINYFDLKINHDLPKTSLAEMSEKEPMFLRDFSLSNVEVVSANLASNEIDVRLTGTGLRRSANLFVDASLAPVEKKKVKLLSATSLHATIKPAKPENWRITYRLGTEEATVSYKSGAPSIETIENPSNGKAEGSVDGGTIVTIRGKNLQNVRHVLFGEREASIVRKDAQVPEVIFVRVPEGQLGAVHVILTGGSQNDNQPTNIADFATPGKAIYSYTPSTKVSTPFTPSIDNIENPTTGKAEGPADEDVSVVIRGINLQDIENVFFGRRKGEILERGPHVLFVRVPRGDEGGVPVLIQTSERPDKTRATNIDDFKIPGRAIYKYTSSVRAGANRTAERSAQEPSVEAAKRTPLLSVKPKSRRVKCSPCR